MKPKTLDERVTDSVRETLGNCQLQMLRLQAENDMLRERHAVLEATAGKLAELKDYVRIAAHGDEWDFARELLAKAEGVAAVVPLPEGVV